MAVNFAHIPVAEVFLATWLGGRPELRLLDTRVVAYLHSAWVRPKSSPRYAFDCLVLAKFTEGDTTQFLLAPIHKMGSQGSWGVYEMECGDRYSPPMPDFQYFSSLPSKEQVRDFIEKIGFFDIGSETTVIESIGRDFGTTPKANDRG